jgi:hypothetical protein
MFVRELDVTGVEGEILGIFQNKVESCGIALMPTETETNAHVPREMNVMRRIIYSLSRLSGSWER